MIDNFALALTHALMLIAAWRLVRRPELDDEGGCDPDMRRRGRASGREPQTDA